MNGKTFKNEKAYTLEEIFAMLRDIANGEQPFWGKTVQIWQNGKIILFEETNTRKPK